jgi:hypothetical protein
MHILLPGLKRQLIMKASCCPKSLGRTIAELKATYPDAFHSDTSLGQRVFLDQPDKDIPHRRYLRPSRHTVETRSCEEDVLA